jgi:hypothetical protein
MTGSKRRCLVFNGGLVQLSLRRGHRGARGLLSSPRPKKFPIPDYPGFTDSSNPFGGDPWHSCSSATLYIELSITEHLYLGVQPLVEPKLLSRIDSRGLLGGFRLSWFLGPCTVWACLPGPNRNSILREANGMLLSSVFDIMQGYLCRSDPLNGVPFNLAGELDSSSSPELTL